MSPLSSLAAVAAAVGGSLEGGAWAEAVVTSVVVDSRLVQPGSLFVCLPGETSDGHDFAAGAVAAGAVAVLSSREVRDSWRGDEVVAAVRVADPLVALQQLAAAHLASLPSTTVVGVTGSAGKTTTKDLLAAVLAPRGPLVAPPGSFNNEIGLPLTVLRATAETRTLVLEYGARGVGHIRALTRIAPVAVGVVVNVGRSHVGEFGTVEATAVAKAELVEDSQIAVLNADDPRVRVMAAPGLRILAGEALDASVRAEDVRIGEDARASFTLVVGAFREPVSLRLVGEHQISNALLAAAAALALGLDLAGIAAALSAAEPASGSRMAVHERSDGVTVVDDAYNANPESMASALKSLVTMTRNGRGRSWAVLGEMKELGDDGPTEHDLIGRLAVRLDVSRLVTVGDPSGPIGRLHAGAVMEGSWGVEALHLPDIDAALAHLRANLAPGDVVLVKASHSVGLERLASQLVQDSP